MKSAKRKKSQAKVTFKGISQMRCAAVLCSHAPPPLLIASSWVSRDRFQSIQFQKLVQNRLETRYCMRYYPVALPEGVFLFPNLDIPNTCRGSPCDSEPGQTGTVG